MHEIERERERRGGSLAFDTSSKESTEMNISWLGLHKEGRENESMMWIRLQTTTRLEGL